MTNIDTVDVIDEVHQNFIDSSYDFEKRTYRDPLLRDFCYVSSASDVISRLEKLKDSAFRKKIVDLQIEDTKIDINLYCRGLYEILERGNFK